MNEHILEMSPVAPVICVQSGRELVYANHIEVLDSYGVLVGTLRSRPEGYADAGNHFVRVALELEKEVTLRVPGLG